MPTGLGDEKLWLCPTLNNVTPFNDLSVQGNHGTAVGGLSTVADSDFTYGGSRAYDFDGVDDYITYPIAAIDSANSIGSVSAWVKTASTANPGGHIIGGSDTTSTNAWAHLRLDSGQPTVVTYSSGQVGEKQSSTSVSDSQWHHVCVVGDGSNYSIYIDGTLVSSSWIGTPRGDRWLGYPAGMDTGLVGALVRSSGTGNLFDGQMDDIRAYNRTLTQVEITHLSSKRGVLGSPPKGLGDEQLWLCPSLQDSAKDLSNSNNHGTYNGGMGTISDSSKGGSRCYSFDGVDDYIDVTSSDVPAAAYTVSLWQYSTSSAITTAFNAGQVGGERTVNIDGVRAGLSGDNHGHKRGSTSYWASNPTVRTSATWYHYLLTYDGSEIRLYVDGVYTANRTGVQDTDWIEDRCWIGQYMGGSHFFQGRIDDIRTYNRVLTPSEIAHLTSSRGVQGHPTIKGLGDEKLWLCPSLNDSANDISGNANDGVYQNGIATVSDTDATYGGTKAYFSNAQSQYVLVSDFGDSLNDTNSISMWVKSVNPWVCVPVANGGIGYSTSIWQYGLFNSGASRLLWRRSANLTLSGTTPSNQWQHICIIRDNGSSTQEVYINGVLDVTSASFTGTYGTNQTWFGFGNAIGTNEELYMDDIRTYGRVLTQEEIAHLAKSRAVSGSPYNLNGIKHLLSSFIHPLG